MSRIVQLPLLGQAKRQGGYFAKKARKCAEAVAKENMPEVYAPDLKAAPGVAVVERMASGVVFEADVFASIIATAAQGSIAHIVEILDENGERTKQGRDDVEKETFDAIIDPAVTVILGGRIGPVFESLLCQHRGQADEALSPLRISQPDVMLVGPRNADGLPQWLTPVDVKDHKVTSGSSKGRQLQVIDLDAATLGMSGARTEQIPGALKSEDWMQLAHYHRHLEDLALAQAEPWAGIIGRERVIVMDRLDDKRFTAGDGSRSITHSALDLDDQWFGYGLDVVANAQARQANPATPALTFPELKGDCSECEWRNVCKEELESHGDGGHITLLPGVTPARAQKYYQIGVSSIRDLARLDVKTVDEKTQSDVLQARTTSAKHIVRKPGVERVETHRADVEIDFDLENTNGPVIPERATDGSHSGGQLVYLWGTREVRRTVRKNGSVIVRTKVRQFADWTDTDAGEAQAFADFWQFLTLSRDQAIAAGKTWKAFHYTKHECSFMVKLATKHAGTPGVPTVAQVEALLGSGDIVDLYEALTSTLYWPTVSHSIKKLAQWARFSWRASDAGGDNSGVWHKTVLTSSSKTEVNQLRKRLLEYNVDDVAAQVHLRDWIDQLQSAESPTDRIPSAEKLRGPAPRRA